jgi:hypothetical protein
VRLIRPVLVVKAASALLGVALCLPLAAMPASASQTQAVSTSTTTPTAHKTTTHKASTTATAKKTAYSAKASNARKTTLARARASARAREQARLNSLSQLRVAMTPHFKLDANGQEIPDVQAAAAVIFNPSRQILTKRTRRRSARSRASRK